MRKREKQSVRKTKGCQQRIVVKFHSSVNIPYNYRAAKYIDNYEIGAWKKLQKLFPRIAIEPLFTSLKPQKIKEFMQRAEENDQSYKNQELLSFFAIDCPYGINTHDLIKILKSWNSVQVAYLQSKPAPPPMVNADDTNAMFQHHLDPAPDGIDARFAWTIPGGAGEGIEFIDLERGWKLDHEDLNEHGITLISGVNKTEWSYHGTAVLGVVTAVDNSIGCIGIAPNVASVKVVSLVIDSSGNENIANAIMSATNNLNYGDVLLLEAQNFHDDNGTTYLAPVEVDLAVFAVIQTATSGTNGIIVVEAAGNGKYSGPSTELALNLDNVSELVNDSGAIIVGGVTDSTPHYKTSDSNYGSKVDCYAYGQNVNTLTTDIGGTTHGYTTIFDGTSSASAIIAGAAIVLQSIAETNLGIRQAPIQIRDWLRNVGTEIVDQPGKVMPDLKKIICDYLYTCVDVYIRDNIADNGDPHTGSISSSPDIIVRPNVEPDPQGAFGEGSGRENDSALGYEAIEGLPNYIYVRVKNRGAIDTNDVVPTIYWSEVSLIPTPDMWNLIDDEPPISIPNVPSGDTLEVSEPIVWSSVPATGHYCFIGIIGNTDDPPPNPFTSIVDWDSFRAFIRNYNNATWRNFNVVANEAPPPSSGFVPLEFIIPGAFDKSRKMEIEAIAKFPKGTKIILECPLSLMAYMPFSKYHIKVNKKEKVGRVELNPYGKNNLGSLRLPVKSRIKAKILVKIPEKYRSKPYSITVRQLYQKEELGRVTWKLIPTKQKEKLRRPFTKKSTTYKKT